MGAVADRADAPMLAPMSDTAQQNPNAPSPDLVSAIRAKVEADAETIKKELTELVAFPSVHGEEDTKQALSLIHI